MRSSAFTLIELLVVITIIVVLLSLLAPALDKAIYQAELVQCAGKLKAVASAVQIYAFENKRHYPDRRLQEQNPDQSGFTIQPKMLRQPTRSYDMRPLLREYFSINDMLQCPLNAPVDFEDLNTDGAADASYNMWWGWQYEPINSNPTTDNGGAAPGMHKVGDRWGWDNERYDTLVGDFDLTADGVQGSHPDDEGAMAPVVAQNQSFAGVGVGDAQVAGLTFSFYVRQGAPGRGLIDMNHAFSDGSVARYDGVQQNRGPGDKQHDARMDRVPMQWNVTQNWKTFQIPQR